MARQKGVSARIVDYLVKHPGEIVNISDIASSLNLKASQVTQTMWNLRARKPEFGDLETIEAGKQWRYNPNGMRPSPPPKKTPDLSEVEVMRRAAGGRGPRTQGPVLEYMTKRPNEVLTMDALTAGTGLDSEQIRRAISNLRGKGNRDIVTVVTGQAWRYSPGYTGEPPQQEERPATRGLFEQIGTDKKGVIIVRGEDDQLYGLKPLELDI